MYAALPKISVDYAVMERSDRCAMVPASFQWNDVGSWDEVASLERPDDDSTVVEVEARNNFVHSDLPVAICGIDDLHVVVKNGVVLVCKKGESQLVKQVVTDLQERGRADLL
jgi:mannose-1-phosphate guanylyltransferase/mannose-1-phosphate guanylyltransferase/mannose-6-phosphate isomerase